MPGNSDETVMLFCGRVDSPSASGVHGLADEHEDIRVVVKTLAELEAMVDAGQIETGHTLICLYWLLAPPRRTCAGTDRPAAPCGLPAHAALS